MPKQRIDAEALRNDEITSKSKNSFPKKRVTMDSKNDRTEGRFHRVNTRSVGLDRIFDLLESGRISFNSEDTYDST